MEAIALKVKRRLKLRFVLIFKLLNMSRASVVGMDTKLVKNLCEVWKGSLRIGILQGQIFQMDTNCVLVSRAYRRLINGKNVSRWLRVPRA